MPERETAAPPIRALQPFENLSYRYFWFATLLSYFGTAVQSMGAAWLMTSLSSSELMVSLVQGASTLPVMLLALFTGALADRLDRRLLMLFSQVTALIAALGLAGMTWSGRIEPASLLALTFVIGMANALYSPAWQASVRDLVPHKQLPTAIGLNAMAFNLARCAAPGVGALLLATWGAATTFGFNALSFLGLVLVILIWSGPAHKQQGDQRSLLALVGEGVRHVRDTTAIRRLLFRCLVLSTSASVFWSLTPVFSQAVWGDRPEIYAALLTAFGAGAIVSALFTIRLRTTLGTQKTALWAQGLAGLSAVGLSFTPPLYLALLGFATGGAATISCFVIFNSSTQMDAARQVAGRVMSLYQVCLFGGLATGALLWGSLARFTDVQTAILYSGLWSLLLLAPFMRWPLVEADAGG